MKSEWTGKIVGEMHVNEISQQMLADETGYSRPYINQLLNSRRPQSEWAAMVIEDAIETIKKRQAESIA